MVFAAANNSDGSEGKNNRIICKISQKKWAVMF